MKDTPTTNSGSKTGSNAVTLSYRRQTFTVKPGMTLRDAIIKCDLNPETTLATRDGALITDEVILRPGELVKLIATISGG